MALWPVRDACQLRHCFHGQSISALQILALFAPAGICRQGPTRHTASSDFFGMQFETRNDLTPADPGASTPARDLG
jgi:hypothetical protein